MAEKDPTPTPPIPDPPLGLLADSRIRRLQLVSAAVVSYLIFWWTGELFRIPLYRCYEISLLAQPAWFLRILITIVAFCVCSALSTAIAGSVRYSAGVFAAAIGLAALSARGGAGRYVWFWAEAHGEGSAMFLRLMLELVLLFAGVCLAWLGALWLHRRGIAPAREEPDGIDRRETTPAYRLKAVILHIIVTLLALMVLATTDEKQQALVAVGIAAVIGSAFANYYFPAPRMSGWYILGTLIAGLIGYALNWTDPQGIAIGHLNGQFAPLARPLPLDYASAGAAGAIFGYWTGATAVHAFMEMIASLTTIHAILSSRWQKRMRLCGEAD